MMIQQQRLKFVHQATKQYQFQGLTDRLEALLLFVKISSPYREVTPMTTQQWSAQTL